VKAGCISAHASYRQLATRPSEDCRQGLSKKAIHEICHVVEDAPRQHGLPPSVSQSLSCQSTAAIPNMYRVKPISRDIFANIVPGEVRDGEISPSYKTI